MATGKNLYRVLVASTGTKTYDSICELLPKTDYEMLPLAGSVGEVRRTVLNTSADIIIINAPLPDEFGTQLALDMADENYGVMLLVPTEVYDQICFKVEDFGVMTLAKPFSRKGFFSAVKLVTAMRAKLNTLNKKNQALQEKMMDIRTVNRAKWLLIEQHHMSESDAHYYIERKAMDMRMTRRQVAEDIIRTYD